LNRDRRADIAIVTAPNTGLLLTTFFNSGSGTFTQGSSFSVNLDQVAHMIAADINADGFMDILMSDYQTTPSVAVFLGASDGNLTAASYFGPNADDVLAVGDVNADGVPDLVTSVHKGSKIAVYLNTTQENAGSLTFSDAIMSSGVMHNLGIALADFNGDGILDAVQSDFFNNYASVVCGTAKGTFTVAGQYNFAHPYPSLSSPIVGDFNEDGHLDFAIANWGTSSHDYSSVDVFLNNGDGTFASAVEYASPLTSPNPEYVTVADVNGDGHQDLITGGGNNGTAVWLGGGNGQFTYSTGWNQDGRTGPAYVGLVNNDRYSDIVTFLCGSTNLSLPGSLQPLLYANCQ
jgi:hypothetical protein